MSDVNMDNLLVQMRSMASKIEGLQPTPVKPAGESGFSDMLSNAVNSVNETQQASGSLKQAFELGDESVDLLDVMVASQKADISFRTMTEVRNKLVSAYQEIMNMPV